MTNKIIWLVIAAIFLATPCWALDVTLQWDANTESDLAGYKVYYDTDSGDPYDGTDADEGYAPIIMIFDDDENPDPDIVEYTLHNLEDGITYYFAVTAYDDQDLESGCSNEVNTGNIPPVADAGSDQIVDSGTLVALDCSGSYDEDDGIADILWEQTAGIAVNLSDYAAIQPTFIVPAPGGETLTFKVTVTDYEGLSSEDTVDIVVNPEVVYIPEDVNEDGVVDMADYWQVRNNLGHPVSDCPRCDVQRDGDIDNYDLRAVYIYIRTH